MKNRSKIELNALKAAYETGILVQSFMGSVIADPDDEMATPSDIEAFKNADIFIKWYEKNICAAKA